ncbi:hypothetical protein K440DRAFT_664675 [Wilcoxina mikolae CBS 423.85]|nr:hypothetical protein K440DRAFT_664675 [Wilcoxina mikolae CBS 423.85]
MNLHIHRFEECDKSFPTEVILSWHRLSGCKLLQHLENLQVANIRRITPNPWIPKPQATVGTWCRDCNRHFNTIGSLERHLKSAKRHNPASAAHAFPTTRPTSERVESIAKYQPPHQTEIQLRPKSAKIGKKTQSDSGNTHPPPEDYTCPHKCRINHRGPACQSRTHFQAREKKKAQITVSQNPNRRPRFSPYDKDARSIQNLFSGHQLCETFPWNQYRRKLTKYKSRDDNACSKKRGWRGMVSSRVANKGGLYSRDEGWESLESACWHIPGKRGKRKANRSRKAQHDKYGVMQTEEWEDEVWLEQE